MSSPPPPDVPAELPVEVLVDAADAALHPWVRAHVATAERRAALTEELGGWLAVLRDPAHGPTYAAAVPRSGQPPEAYVDRWLPLATGGHVLAGPRYLGRDPDLPFVGVAGADRVLAPADADALRALAREHFAAFEPGFVLLTSAEPVESWPGALPEMRQVVGRLGDLRARDVPAGLGTRPRTDTDFYDEYARVHHAHVAREPAHARHARAEEREDLQALADQGLLHDVLVDGRWAGVLAAEPDARHGLRGATVVELFLDEAHRGHGHGRHLSVLLARALPMPDEAFLLGTIHADNVASYRAALGAGRVDVGGEVVLPLTSA